MSEQTTGTTPLWQDEASGEVRVARAGLLRAAEVPAPGLVGFVDRVGPVPAWQRVIAGDLPQGVRSAVLARTAERGREVLQQQAIDDLRLAERSGARLVIPEDDEWPEATMIGLAMADDAKLTVPLGLWVRGGRLPADPRGVVTVIGSRACTAYGRRVGSELAGDLAAAGCLVVSGAAFGVDAAAHRGAMAAGGAGSTLAVLACGIDQVYPVANRELVDEIARGGGIVVTEYPPGTTPARHRFLVRNRLIAAFGSVTVVVEAGRRSGTISTATVAGKINRQVMAVPGPVTSALSLGCHELLRKPGVSLATKAADILENVGMRETTMPSSGPARPTDRLSPEAARMYEALPAKGVSTVAELVAESGVPGREAMAGLAELELLDLAQRAGPRWWRNTDGPAEQ